MTYLTRVGRVLVTNASATNVGTSLATIQNGDILITNRSTNVEASLNTDKIFIAQGLGGGAAILGDSNGIVPRSITKITHRPYVAPTQQVLTIGPLTAPTNNTQYRLRILFKDDQRPAADARPTQRDFYMTTDSSATSVELGQAMSRRINNDIFLKGKVSATLITDGTFTALTGNASVINGVPTVTSTAHGLVAGDLVRIGGAAATFPVYTVKSVTTNTFTLFSPYQGTSGTVLAANVGKITAATSMTIRITTLPMASNGIDIYSNYNIAASLSPVYNTTNFSNDTATITSVSGANKGSGFWQEVRDLEYFASGYLIGANRTLFPVQTTGAYSTRAVPGGTYSIVVIEFYDKHTGDRQDQMESPKNCIIAFDISTGTGKRDTFLASLTTVTGIPVESPTLL